MMRWFHPVPGRLPIPSSVRYHALALCLRVGGGTILPTRRRRGRSTPAPAALDQQHRHGDHGGAQSSRTDDHTHGGDHGGDHTHGGDHGGGDHKASTLTATTYLTASIGMVGEPGYAKRCASRYTNGAGMEANQRNARWSGFAATRFPHRRDGGDLSYGGSFPKSDTNGGEPEERTVDGISIAVLSRWRRSVNLGTT